MESVREALEDGASGKAAVPHSPYRWRVSLHLWGKKSRTDTLDPEDRGPNKPCSQISTPPFQQWHSLTLLSFHHQMDEPTFLCPTFFPPIILIVSFPSGWLIPPLCSLRTISQRTMLSGYPSYRLDYSLSLPLLGHSHVHTIVPYLNQPNPTVTCSPSQPNCLKELSIHFVFTSSPPSPSSSHSSTCSPNVGLLRVQSEVPSSLLSTVEKQINSTNRSCLSLTLLFLLIYRSIFSPCLQQRECVSTYVWWWQESLRTRWGEQEYGRRHWPHLSASACCSPLHRQLTVAAEEEAWEQGEEGREGDKGNVTKGAVISLQKNTTLWAAGEKGQVQNVWSQNGRCDCARLCTIQTGPRRVSGEMDRPYKALAMLQQPHSPCWATHLGAAVPTGPQDGADWTAAPSHLSRREPRDPAEAGEGPRGWDQICAEACRLQEPLRKLLRF